MLEAVAFADPGILTVAANLVHNGLLTTKVPVQRRLPQCLPPFVHDIPQLKTLLHKEIARINITIVFHDKILTAVLPNVTDISNPVNK